jgi:hypothetical protein
MIKMGIRRDKEEKKEDLTEFSLCLLSALSLIILSKPFYR